MAAALALLTIALPLFAQDPSAAAPANGEPPQIVRRIGRMFDLYAERGRAREAASERQAIKQAGCTVDTRYLPVLLARAGAARARIGAEEIRLRAWFEQAVAATLVEVGHSGPALAGLDRFTRGLDLGALPDKAKGYVSEALALHVDLLRAHGDYDAAIRLGEATIAIRPEDSRFAQNEAKPARLANARRRSAHALGALATTYIELGVPESAAPLVIEQNRLAKLSRLAGAIERADRVMASYHRVVGRPEAIVRAFDGPAEERSAHDSWLTGLALRDLSLRDPKHRAAAVAALRQAVASGGLSRSQNIEAQVVLADLLLAAEDFEAADGALRAARALLDMLRPVDGATEQLARIAAIECRTQRLRLRGLDGGELRAMRPGVGSLRAAFGTILRDWSESTPVRRAGLGFLTPPHRRLVLSELVDLVWAVEGETAAAKTMLECMLEVQRLSSLARELGVAAATPEEIRRDFLREGDGALILLPSQYQSHLLAFDRDELRIFRLPGWSRLLADIEAYRNELRVSPGGRPPPDLERWAQGLVVQGRALTQRILDAEALEMLGRWRSVTVADTGLLRGVPLECLVLDGGRLLGETIAVNTLDSLPLGRHLLWTKYRPGTVGEAALDLLATLQAAPELAPMARAPGGEPPRFGADRVDQLEEPYASCRRLLDEALTVRALLAWNFDASVAHIVAHGARQARRERAVGLALAPEPGHDNGWFGADEADTLDTRGRVPGAILLSACGAARGRQRIGDASYQTTLAASFLRAGAHTVVQSAADLVLGPHIAFMAQVHAQLANGATTAEALRRARVAVARSHSLALRFQHAQLQVFGLGNHPVVTAKAAPAKKRSPR